MRYDAGLGKKRAGECRPKFALDGTKGRRIASSNWTRYCQIAGYNSVTLITTAGKSFATVGVNFAAAEIFAKNPIIP